MTKLGVELSVDNFEAYRSKMLAAQRLATDTHAVINRLQNPTFGNYNKLPEAVKRATDLTDRIVKQSADRQISEAERVAKAIERINQQTVANRRQQEALLSTTWNEMGSVGSRAGQLSPETIRRRQADRSADALAVVQGRTPGSALTGEQRYGRINLARQGADVFTQLGSGQGLGITAIQQGPQIVEAMAMSGLKLSGAMAGVAAAAGVGAAAIGAAYLITTKMADVEAKRLKIIEEGVAAYGRINMLAKNSQAEYARQTREQIAVIERGDETVAQMRARRALLQANIDRDQNDGKVRARAGYFGNEEQTKAYFDAQNSEASKLDVDIARGLKRETAIADKEFAGRWDEKKKQIDEAAKRAQAFADDSKKGQERVVELGKSWRETFTGAVSNAYEDNPFVKVFIEGRSEMEKFREGIKGLPKDMQASMLASQEVFSAKKLFAARIDNVMSAFDLRELAATYRDDTAQRRAFAQGGFERQKGYDDGRIQMGGVNVEAIREYQGFRQRFIDRQFQSETPADKLDRQLTTLDRLDPRNTGEQALLDQRILRTASGIDPASLNSGTRERLAQIAERSAEREEKRFQEAMDVRKQMAASLKLLSGEEAKLNNEVAKVGSQAIDIRIKNETSDSVEVERPTQADTNRAFSLIGGTNR